MVFSKESKEIIKQEYGKNLSVMLVIDDTELEFYQ